MKLFMLLALTVIASQGHAARFASGKIVGGPLKGDCKIIQNQIVTDSFTFDTMPSTKSGISLDRSGKSLVQVINDSFKNSLNISVIASRRMPEPPPSACVIRRGYNICDFVKSRWAVPAYSETRELTSLAGALEVVDPDGMYGGEPTVVDSYQITIGDNNDALNESIQLKVDGSRTLACEISYVNLF